MKRLFIILLVMVAVTGIVYFNNIPITSSTRGVEAAGPTLEGTAYVATHGGHVVMVDLAKRSVIGRKVIDVIGGDTSKGFDGVTLSPDGKILHISGLNGRQWGMDVETKEILYGPIADISKKACGARIGPDGNIWIADMKDGNLYIYDPNKRKTVDVIPSGGKSICGIAFTKDGKYAYTSDMPGGFVTIIDLSTKKVIAKIEGVGEFLHQAEATPDGSEIWVTNGREMKAGQKFSVESEQATKDRPGELVVFDTKTQKIKTRVVTGGSPHHINFTPDGKYGVAVVRRIPVWDDTSLAIIDVQNKKVVESFGICKGCHDMSGVKVKVDLGNPNACGLDIAWKELGGKPFNYWKK